MADNNQIDENIDDISPVNESKAKMKVSPLRNLVAVTVSYIGPIIFGITMGYSSPSIPNLQKSREQGGMNFTTEQASWFGSIVAMGALIGGPIASLVIDKLGRKYTVMLSALPFCIGWLLIIAATDVLLLYFGRLFTGIGTGMCSLAVPTYIAETAPVHLRGMLGAGFQLSVTIGVLTIFGLGMTLNYIWLAVFSSVLTVVHVITMIFVPETSRQSGQVDKMSSCDEESEAEDEVVHEMKLKDIFVYPAIYKPLIVIIFTMMLQQFSGINAVMFYSESIFHGAGFENEGSIPSVILATIQVIMTFVSCLIVDKLGRKVLLIISGTLMSFTSVSFSLYYLLIEKYIIDDSAWYAKALSLGSLGIYISAFSIGWGPIPWLYMSELLPHKARGICSGIATAVNWICAFLVTKFFSSLQNEIHSYGTFWVFAGINLAGVIYVILVLRETRGKSLEEIERYYSHKDGFQNLMNADDDNN